MYALMTKKSIEQYVEVLTALKLQLDGKLPLSVLTDFEKGELESFKRIFPNIELSACLFHLGQAFLRRLKKLGLIKRFNDNNIRKTFRLSISLAFLPPETVRKAFALIVSNATNGMEG